jgi:hypothetical protein
MVSNRSLQLLSTSTVRSFSRHLLAEGIFKQLYSLRIPCAADIDKRETFGFGVVYFLGCQSHFAAYEGVICVAVCTVKTSRVEGAAQVCTPGDDKIELVPVARRRVSPGDFVAIFTLEVCVGHTQTTVAAQFQQSLSIIIHLPVPRCPRQEGRARCCSRLPF